MLGHNREFVQLDIKRLRLVIPFRGELVLTNTTNSSWVSSSLRSPTCKLTLYGGAKGSKILPPLPCVAIVASPVASA